jgi:hypothetical protein
VRALDLVGDQAVAVTVVVVVAVTVIARAIVLVLVIVVARVLVTARVIVTARVLVIVRVVPLALVVLLALVVIDPARAARVAQVAVGASTGVAVDVASVPVLEEVVHSSDDDPGRD